MIHQFEMTRRRRRRKATTRHAPGYAGHVKRAMEFQKCLSWAKISQSWCEKFLISSPDIATHQVFTLESSFIWQEWILVVNSKIARKIFIQRFGPFYRAHFLIFALILSLHLLTGWTGKWCLFPFFVKSHKNRCVKNVIKLFGYSELLFIIKVLTIPSNVLVSSCKYKARQTFY